jgi:hypothetical protein
MALPHQKNSSTINSFCLFVTGIDKIQRTIFVFDVTFSAKTAKMWLAQSLQNTMHNFLIE